MTAASAAAVADASPTAADASSLAAWKREKANSVAKGDATWYILAVPSSAPSAIAEVVKEPVSG